MSDLRVDTHRFGRFTFQLGLDPAQLDSTLARVEDAWDMFRTSPLAEVASQLQREVLVQSVFGTNTIEGADLSEEETGRVLDMEPARIQAEQEVRVRNIRAAYALAVQSAENPQWLFSVDYVKAIHAEISRDLQHPDNVPGRFRDNPKERPTLVGDAAHGGIYKPPQFGRDVSALMDALVRWHDGLVADGVSPFIRAPLVHLYFELIHPFWDGNGRVGRVIEATLLRQSGIKYAPFALAKFYQEQIHRYFALFNTCRKAHERGAPNPNLPFVEFHLEGMLVVIKRLHERVNFMIKQLLFEAEAMRSFESGDINVREYAIVRHVINHGRPMTLATLRADPSYKAMYAKKTDKTRQRDLKRLVDLNLLQVDAEGLLRPRFVAG